MPRVSVFFFRAVVQAVLLFGSETWVVTPRTGKALGGFQTQVARRLTGRLLWRIPEDRMRYTSEAATSKEAGLLMMGYYISRRQNTVAQYITTISLLELCKGLQRALGALVGIWWWEQVVIGLEGGIGSGSGAGRRGRGRRVTEGNKKDSRGREKVRVQYINL